VVELAAEGLEVVHVFRLVSSDSCAYVIERRGRIVEHIRAEGGYELLEGRRRALQANQHLRSILIGHFERAYEWLHRLCGQTRGAPITKEPAAWRAILDGERRSKRCVHEGGRVAESRLVHVASTERHGKAAIDCRVAGERM